MAEAEGAEHVFVGLALEEANAGIQLLGDGDILVVLGESAYEG